MARAAPDKRKITELLVQKIKPRGRAFCVWDTHQRGLVLRVQPSGNHSWFVVYSRQGRPRWYHVGGAAIGLADARRVAARVMLAAAEGTDPAADRAANRSTGTFENVATRFRDEHAKKKNKSWRQGAVLVQKHLIPVWGKLAATAITRHDAKNVFAGIASPTVANQVLAHASAIFAWAIREEIVTVNPVLLIERHVTKSRDRVLSESEIPRFWQAFGDLEPKVGAALKLTLLLGQRPGEISALCGEHIADGWWTLPGAPVVTLSWPGTKNGHSHRVWLPAAAQALLGDLVGTSPARTLDKMQNAMKTICATLGVERATPHDLRRTHGTLVTGLGFGRDAMNRIQNHVEGGIASVYDRHGYAGENQRIMEAVASRIMALKDGQPTGNVVTFSR